MKVPSMGGSEAFAVLESMQGAETLILVLCIAYGLLVCFFGFKIFRIQVAIAGFLMGAAIASGVLLYNKPYAEAPLILIAALVGGVIGALIAYHLYLIGVFFTGFCCGGAIVGIIMYFASETLDAAIPLGIIGGIVVGVLSVIFNRPVIIVLTGLNGGSSTVIAALALISGNGFLAIYSTSIVQILLGFVLGIVGCVFQFKTTTKKKKINVAPAPTPATATASVSVSNNAPVAAPVYNAAPAFDNAPKFDTAPAPAFDNAPKFDAAPAPIAAPAFDNAPKFDAAPAPAPVAAPAFDNAPKFDAAPEFKNEPKFDTVPAPAPMAAPVFKPAPVPMAAPVAAAPQFCSSCGAPRSANALFCAKCGTKF